MLIILRLLIDLVKAWARAKRKPDVWELELRQKIERFWLCKSMYGSVLPVTEDLWQFFWGFGIVIFSGFLFGTSVSTIVGYVGLVLLLLHTFVYLTARLRRKEVNYKDAPRQARELARLRKRFTEEESNLVQALIGMEVIEGERPFLLSIIRSAKNSPTLYQTEFFRKLAREYSSFWNRL